MKGLNMSDPAVIDQSLLQRRRRLTSAPSTESEGPTIVINGSSASDTDEERSFKWQPYETFQKTECMGILDRDSSMPSSSTDMTSEGAESEVEKRWLTPESIRELLKFLEDTFSDEGLSKNLFLLKHVRRYRHGFVSLKLLASYKQAKKNNCGWRMLAKVAKLSTNLELDREERKIRRIKKLPDKLLHAPTSRVLAVVDLREDLSTMERLASTFGKFGEVSSLQLIKQKHGRGIPSEIQSLAARVPKVAHTFCAILQFEDIWEVAKALEEFKHPHTAVYSMNQKQKGSSRSTSVPTFRNSTSPHKHKNSYCEFRKELRYEWKIKSSNYIDSTASDSKEEMEPGAIKITGRKTRSLQYYRSSPFCNSIPGSPGDYRRKLPPNSRLPVGPDGTKGFHQTNAQDSKTKE